MTSLVAQTVKHLPTMRETRFQSLGREDLLEEEMATHSSILAWKNPMDGGAWWSKGSQRVRTRLERLHFNLVISNPISFLLTNHDTTVLSEQ